MAAEVKAGTGASSAACQHQLHLRLRQRRPSKRSSRLTSNSRTQDSALRSKPMQLSITAGSISTWIWSTPRLTKRSRRRSRSVIITATTATAHGRREVKRPSIALPAVPAGEYFLTVEPSADAKIDRLPFTVRVKSGGVFFGNCIVVLFLVMFYPIMLLWRFYLREKERWSESDFSPYTSS